MASNDTGRSEDLEALFGRLQGMPIQPKPINVNREEDLTHILSNLEQQIARIMTTQFDKFEERVQGIDILPNLEEQIARIMTTQLNRFENRVQSMYIYPTPVKPNQEPGLTGIVRNLEQQISRIMTAQHNKFQGIIGVVNSLRTDYEQMSTKFEKLQADFTVVQARLDVLSSADKHKEVHAGEEKASHTEMNDIRGGVATKSSEDDHDEIDAQLGMGLYRGMWTPNADSISRLSKIYPRWNGKKEEPENAKSTHEALNNTTSGNAVNYYPIKQRSMPIFAYEEEQ